jgi:hypothetical protein
MGALFLQPQARAVVLGALNSSVLRIIPTAYNLLLRARIHHGRLVVCYLVVSRVLHANVLSSWYKGIAPKTRIVIGVTIMAYAGFGLFVSDKAEEQLGFVPTEKDKEDLRKAIPRIIAVDKEK